MKNITNEEKRLWTESSQPKDLTITLIPQDRTSGENIVLTNSDILSESLEITQILESGKTLSFGDVNASSLKFKCRDFETDVRGWKLEAVLSFKEYPQYSQKVFVGKVYNQTNQNHEDVTTTITAYDPIKTIFESDKTEWWEKFTISNDSTFSVYAYRIINELAMQAGCQGFSSADSDVLANLNQKIATKPDLKADFNSISGEMLIKWIAQACNVYITYDASTNKLKPIKLKLMGEPLVPHIGLYPHHGLHPRAGVQDLNISKSKYISATYEPYKTEKIDQVVITDKGNIGEGQYPVQKNPGNNILYVDGNPFLWSMNMMECAEVIYNRVHDVYFTPSTIKTSGTVFMELGDVVRVFTVKNVIQSYILKRTMKGINSIRDTFINKSEQYQTSHTPSYADVTDLQAQSILRIQADIVEIKKIQAEDIDASRITTGTLDANKVTIQNLEVKDSMIAKGSISADKINANLITTNNLSSQTIYATQIDVSKGKISASKIDVDNLTVEAANVKNLSFGKLSGTIGSGQISANVFSGKTVVAQNFSVPSTGRFNVGNYTFAPTTLYYKDHNGKNRTQTVLIGQT